MSEYMPGAFVRIYMWFYRELRGAPEAPMQSAQR